ncbi:competence protein [Streptococcus pneumoniae]|nr:competence protein [Streptococcus pneumoniae]
MQHEITEEQAKAYKEYHDKNGEANRKVND